MNSNTNQFPIAFCSIGVLGVITSNEKQKVTYADGNTGEAYTGFVIHDTIIQGIRGDAGKLISVKQGDLWCSKVPEIICHISDLNINQEPELIAKEALSKIQHLIKKRK